jgi:membrane associated rhomboid family serine protease
MERHRFDIGPPDWGPGTRLLLVLSALGWGLGLLLPREIFAGLALPNLLRPWSLVTSIFLSEQVTPFIITAIMLWMFGNTVEAMLGRNRQVGLFVAAGAVGNATAAIFTHFLYPQYGWMAPPAGASYSIGALFYAWAFFHRDSSVRLMFLVPINAWMLVYGSLGLSAVYALTGSPGGVGSLCAGLATLGYLSRRRHGTWNPFGDLQRKADDAYRKWNLKRKSAHLQVLKGGKDDAFVRDDEAGDDKPPIIH